MELVFGHTHDRTNGWTDRRDVGNSILDDKLQKRDDIIVMVMLEFHQNLMDDEVVKVVKDIFTKQQ